MRRWLLPLLLILLLAFALRSYRLTAIPPGLTHDEANHGREAMALVDGVFLFFFPLNYGSEPLYSYTVAGAMFLLGQNLLALRLVNVFFSLAAIAITSRWAARAFDRRTALLAAALMAVSFWPLASSRQALRAGMLPFFMAGAIWFFWQLLREDRKRAETPWRRWWPALGFGVCVAATLHIYLAARVAWLLFPFFLAYLAMVRPGLFRRAWLPALAGLLLAGLMVTPMLLYLERHPEALTRLDMLNRPLQELRQGDFMPTLGNAGRALLAFGWPGYGDQFLAYNIPGRPVLNGITAGFCLFGFLTCLWRWRRLPYAFLLLWFATGVIPSLLTGPTANTTRNLAALPAVYLLPAVGFMAAAGWLAGRWRHRSLRPILAGVAGFWLVATGWMTARDYFVIWGEAPAVRGAYQHTLVEALTYVAQRAAVESLDPVVVSTVYPGPAHDDSIGQLLLAGTGVATRWVDARYGLLFPHQQEAQVIIPMSTPPHPAFAGWLQSLQRINLRPDDLDPGFIVYQLGAAPWSPDVPPLADFDGAVQLCRAYWLTATVSSGATAELVTVWRVLDPARVGPVAPPAYTTNVALFTHVLLDESGAILTQHDGLDAPSWSWQPGDVIVQVHPLAIPVDTAPGVYEVAVGLYDRASGERRPVVDGDGRVVDTRAFVSPLEVTDH